MKQNEAISLVEASKLALEALETGKPMFDAYWGGNQHDKAITALRTAIEQCGKQEPRGYQWLDTAVFRKKLPENAEPDAWNALYTTPPAAQRAGPLTDEQLEKLFPAIASWYVANKTLYRSIARAIEAAHGITEKGGAA